MARIAVFPCFQTWC